MHFPNHSEADLYISIATSMCWTLIEYTFFFFFGGGGGGGGGLQPPFRVDLHGPGRRLEAHYLGC